MLADGCLATVSSYGKEIASFGFPSYKGTNPIGLGLHPNDFV